MSTPSNSPDSGSSASPLVSPVLPLISVVLVSYNQAQFLREALESLMAQDYPNLEFLVMDGGSTDGSAEIIEEFRDRLAYYHIGPDGGAAAALNAGFAEAKGRFFAYLNSDDVLHPVAASAWAREFEKSGADVVFGDIRIIDEKGQNSHLPGRKVSLFKAAPFNLRRMAAGGCTIPQQASAWKREVHDAVGGFVEENKSCWDGEFFVDAALRGFSFHAIRQELALFRVHSNSISGTGKHEEARRRDKARMRQKLQDAGLQMGRLQQKVLLRWDQVLRAMRYWKEK